MAVSDPFDHLPTLDKRGSRQRVIPADVHGRYRTWRDRVYSVLILIFLGLPWMRVNGMQAVRLDLPNRHFTIFGRLFMAHDAPLFFFILFSLALALAIMTAVWGRIWCGWACPQTVFIDGIYRRIEILIEGNYLERRKLLAGPLTAEKAFKATLKWMAFFVVSSFFAHSFAAYFTGSEEIVKMAQLSPEQNWTPFIVVTFITALLLVDFGWFREQFCLIVCPYGRFQSVLMDNHSVTVLYDEKRGEPRKAPGVPADKRGDCVGCNRCVQVCPTGIDIRNGMQMECIACTACIDACDEIMRKVNKPEGLIRYQSLLGESAKLWRPRIVAYISLVVFCVLGLTYNVIFRKPYAINVLRAKDAPYHNLPGEMVINHFRLHILNQSSRDEDFELILPESEIAQGIKLTQAQSHFQIASSRNLESHFFLTFPKKIVGATGEHRVQLQLRENGTGRLEDLTVDAVGPKL